MRLINEFNDANASLPAVRQIAWSRPFAWLLAASYDLRANPLPSLAYGILFALGGDLIILAVIRQPQLLSIAISGFFLIAPLLAAGLYELSRRTARGERILFIDSLHCFRRNGQSLAFFGLFLGAISILWERLSAIAFTLLGASSSIDTGAFLREVVFSGEHDAFVVIWFALGGALALLVFALAVVAVPMMLDRNSDVVPAMMTSLRAFIANIGPLLLWAALIVALTLTGFASFLFGLIVIMPILGHASWHAYRDLVE